MNLPGRANHGLGGTQHHASIALLEVCGGSPLLRGRPVPRAAGFPKNCDLPNHHGDTEAREKRDLQDVREML